MSYAYPIYTEQRECRDCYKCVRACPVKAIRVKDGSAVVCHDLCIFCGKCVAVCPAHAKKIRDDVPKAKALLHTKKQVYVSLAPSFSAEFPGQEQQIIDSIMALGFTGISETALGAEAVSHAVDTLLDEEENHTPYISTACPTVVEAIQKYYPNLIPSLTPFHSPLGAHSQQLRNTYGDDIGIVFIGPCIAKKLEADKNEGLPDVAITYGELKKWFESEGIDSTNLKESATSSYNGVTDSLHPFTIGSSDDQSSEPYAFIPRKAAQTVGYAVESGMLATLEHHPSLMQEGASVSGTQEVLAALDSLEEHIIKPNQEDEVIEIPPFFELLSCSGGCINGPGCVQETTSLLRRISSNHYTQKRTQSIAAQKRENILQISPDEIGCTFIPIGGKSPKEERPSKFAIEQALVKLGKSNVNERLNCGGCGYSSCEDFAVAYINGMAEPEMCVTNMRKQAQSKMDVLLRTLPMGVVIVDSHMTIIDCNSQFLKMFSSVTYDADEHELEKISGLQVDSFIDANKYFARQFNQMNTSEHVTLDLPNSVVKATFFTIEPRHLAGALFQDVTAVVHRRDAVMRRAEDVIQKNLQSVQQIASLLGENAADTEIMLSSMIDLFEKPHKQELTHYGKS
jgi:iron only hydrogenase large subunit-like protein